jgi:hypothetical protein
MFAATEPLATDPGSLSAYFEGSQELLHTIADVLDIRSVFPRVSEIASRMVPHDALTMASQDEDLNVQLEATSSEDFRGMTLDSRGMRITPELLVGDLASETLPFAEWPDLRQRVRARGYRSLLRVASQARDCHVSVGFWSKSAHAYDHRHLPLARRIVDHLALGVSHERLARGAGEPARARTGRAESAARTIAPDAASRTHRGIAGNSEQW